MAILVNPVAHLERIARWANMPRHPIMRAPFAIEARGLRWVVGASHAFAVALRSDEIEARDLDSAHVDRVLDTVFGGVAHGMKAPGNRLAALKEWCGPVDWPVAEQCPKCKGEQTVPMCDFCDGVGTMIPCHDQRPGWIGDTLIDRAFLAWTLEPFHDEHVAVGGFGRLDALMVVGSGWIVLVMPRADHAAQRNAPHLTALSDQQSRAGHA